MSLLRLEIDLPASTNVESGTCVGCGCVDERACPEGCSWVDASHLLCTACVARALDLMHERRGNVTQSHDEGGAFVSLVFDLTPKSPARRRRRR